MTVLCTHLKKTGKEKKNSEQVQEKRSKMRVVGVGLNALPAV